MNFATLFAKIVGIIPFAVHLIDTIDTLAGPGKLTLENKSNALKNAIHEVVGTADLVSKDLIPDAANFNSSVDALVSAIFGLHASLKPKKPAI